MTQKEQLSIHERKKNLKNRIKKKKISLLRSVKRITMYVALQCAATIPQPGNNLIGSHAATTGKETRTKIMADIYVDNKLKDAIAKRKEWLIQDKFFSKIVEYQNIIKSKADSDKKNYIKQNFFDTVYPIGGIPKGSNYCIAAMMRCLYDVNKETGDLESFMPDGNTTEGHSMVSCPMFKEYIKKNFPDCIIENPSKEEISSLENGDFIISRSNGRNTTSGLHFTTVFDAQKGLEASFNSDGIRAFKPEKIESIVKFGKIIDICLQEKVKQMDRNSALMAMESGVMDKKNYQLTAMSFRQTSQNSSDRS